MMYRQKRDRRSSEMSFQSCAGQIWAVGLHLPELWRSRRPLTSIEGFNMTTCTRMLGAAKPFSTAALVRNDKMECCLALHICLSL